jgi:hypothetical protein
VGQGSIHVATINGQLGSEAQSNARLIAAAPDLLGALKAVSEKLGGGILDWGDPNDLNDPESEYAQAHKLAELAWKAIAKATERE